MFRCEWKLWVCEQQWVVVEGGRSSGRHSACIPPYSSIPRSPPRPLTLCLKISSNLSALARLLLRCTFSCQQLHQQVEKCPPQPLCSHQSKTVKCNTTHFQGPCVKFPVNWELFPCEQFRSGADYLLSPDAQLCWINRQSDSAQSHSLCVSHWCDVPGVLSKSHTQKDPLHFVSLYCRSSSALHGVLVKVIVTQPEPSALCIQHTHWGY